MAPAAGFWPPSWETTWTAFLALSLAPEARPWSLRTFGKQANSWETASLLLKKKLSGQISYYAYFTIKKSFSFLSVSGTNSNSHTRQASPRPQVTARGTGAQPHVHFMPWRPQPLLHLLPELTRQQWQPGACTVPRAGCQRRWHVLTGPHGAVNRGTQGGELRPQKQLCWTQAGREAALMGKRARPHQGATQPACIPWPGVFCSANPKPSRYTAHLQFYHGRSGHE